METTQSKDVYLETIQEIAKDTKRMFDDEQWTPDEFFINKIKFINLDLSEWTDEVSREITKMFVDQANSQNNPLSFLERLKRMFEAERLAIEKKIGSDEFDRDKQIIFGVKFHSDYQQGQNESRKFSKCIDLAIEELEKGKKTDHVFSDYLTCEKKETIIQKIKEADRSAPKKIYIILKALFDSGVLQLSDNETLYTAYYHEFGYHKKYDTLKRGLNNYDFRKQDKKNQQSISTMCDYLMS